MKKLLVLLATCLLSIPTFAGEILGYYERTDVDVTPKLSLRADTVGLRVSGDLMEGINLRAKFTGTRLENDMNLTNTHIGLAVAPNQYVYLLGGVGYSFPSMSESYSYYTFGGGLVYPITTQLRIYGEVERSLAQNDISNFTTYKTGLGFNFTPKHRVGLSYVMRQGDLETTGVEAIYGYRF